MLAAFFRLREGLVMKQCGLFGVSAAFVLLGTTALQAQVTAEEVWQNWKDLAAGYGQEVTTTGEAMQGDTLVVTGMAFTASAPDAKVTGSLDEVRFREMGDGRVEITMSPRYPIAMELTDGGETVAINLEMTHQNLRMVAGGSADSTSYDFTADRVDFATTGVSRDGEAMPVKGGMALGGFGGNYVVTRGSGDAIDLTSTINAGDLTVTVAATDHNSGGDIAFDLSMAGLAAQTSGNFGAMMQIERLDEALAAGLATAFGLTYGAVAMDMRVVEYGEETTVNAKAAGGSIGGSIDRTRLAYRGGANGVDVKVTGGDMPLPEVTVSYTEAGFDLSVPVGKGDAPQDFGLSVALRDLAVSDGLWSMFDPMGNLPRDPATLVIDAKGAATLTADLFDPDAMSFGPPGMIESLSVPTILVKLIGAELTGDGALTFDNTDLETFGGVPAPTGTINLQLVGANALIDKLVAIGMIPEDQAMGARMMMGMFARPGNGPDTLTSTIEFKDKGFFANGMRLQ